MSGYGDDPGKTGLDDYLAAGHTAADVLRLVRPDLPAVVESAPVEPDAPVTTATPPTVPPIPLAEAHRVFTRWLGEDYDTDALDAVLAAAAVERLNGDPLWLLLISGAGNAKTETVQALDGIGALVVSVITSPGALLSATSRKERTDDATGGLLRKVGARGTLVIKDVTSVLSMDRNARAEVLAALREVYDGRWSRQVGTDGGRSLDWAGRLCVVGAVTTEWDTAHNVIAAMGDRFVLVRMDSTTHRQAAGRQAIGNTGNELTMRAELAAAAAAVLAGMNTDPPAVTGDETEILLAAADVVTLARTAVTYDYRGDVIDAHAPEMPTRFAKQLAQIVRGAVALGVARTDALRLAIRCARDSVPPLRLAILTDVAAHAGSTTADVRKRVGKPRATVDRQLQALQMLGVLECDEEETEWAGRPATKWRYRLVPGLDPQSLDPKSVPDLLVSPHGNTEKEGMSERETVHTLSNISGTDSAPRASVPPEPAPDPPAHTFAELLVAAPEAVMDDEGNLVPAGGDLIVREISTRDPGRPCAIAGCHRPAEQTQRERVFGSTPVTCPTHWALVERRTA